MRSPPLCSDSWGNLWQVPSPFKIQFPWCFSVLQVRATGWCPLPTRMQFPHCCHCCCCHSHCLCPPARETQHQCGSLGAEPGSPTAPCALTALRRPPLSSRPSSGVEQAQGTKQDESLWAGVLSSNDGEEVVQPGAVKTSQEHTAMERHRF